MLHAESEIAALIRSEIEREEHQPQPDRDALAWLRMRLQQELSKSNTGIAHDNR